MHSIQQSNFFYGGKGKKGYQVFFNILLLLCLLSYIRSVTYLNKNIQI